MKNANGEPDSKLAVWKYELCEIAHIGPIHVVELQMSLHHTLHVGVQRGKLCVWCLVRTDTHEHLETETFGIVGTGFEFVGNGFEHVGSAVDDHRGLVAHVFRQVV